MDLLLVLLGSVMLILLAAGAWQLARRKWYAGALAIAAALGPLTLTGLLVVAGIVRRGRSEKHANSAFVGAGAVVLASICALVLYVATGRMAMMGWMILVALWVAMAIGAFYTSVYAYLGTGRMAALMVLRCLAIVALMLILFKPALSYTLGGESKKPYLPILIDRSGSMSVNDDPSLPNRYMQAVQQLRYQSERIEKSFRPMYYHFAQAPSLVEKVDDLAKLPPSGDGTDGTNIAGALEYVVHSLDTDSAPCILLISDGRHNDNASIADALKNVSRPVYVAGVGSTNVMLSGRRNLQIAEVRAPMEAIRNNTTTIKAVVRGVSVPDVEVECRLIDEDTDQTLATDHRSLDKTSGIGEFELKYTPTDTRTTTAPGAPAATGETPKSGLAEVRRLRVAVTPLANEVTEADNRYSLHMLVTNPRIRVMYVAGSIGAGEYKWLKRMLDSDPNVQFVGMYRSQGNTFVSQGTVGGVALGGLPARESDFALFDVIIIHDMDRTFWTTSQLDLLAQWVNKGGGLLMIGGNNSFGPGGYGGTRLEDVMPVLMGDRNMPQENALFLPQLTSAGQAHPIFEGITGFFGGPGNTPPDERLAKLPPLKGCISVVSAKPTATLLAVHPDRRNQAGPLVSLAVQNFGAGRSAAWTADTTWQWRLTLAATGREGPYARFWGQMIRYLAGADSKTRSAGTHVMLRLDRTHLEEGQTLLVRSMVLDQRDKGAELKVSARIIPDDTTKRTSDPMPMVLAEDGLFRLETPWKAPAEGGYTIKVTATDAANKELGSDAIAVTVASHLKEMDRVDRDVATLDEIAFKSGGAYRDVIRLPELLDEIQRRRKEDYTSGPQTLDVALYNFPALFIVFVGLLTAEWLLRRKWQLH